MASSMGPGKMVTDGLVLHLDAGNNKSYPGSGTTWFDLSSTNVSCSLQNGPVFSSVNGGNISFDGTNDYGTINSTDIMSKLTNECTVQIFMNIPTTFTASFGVGVINRANSDSLTTFHIGFDDRAVVRPWNPNGISNNRSITATAGGGGQAYVTLFKTGSFTDNKFSMITFTIATSCSLYWNGILESSAALSGSFQKPNVPIRIGSYYDTGSNDYPLATSIGHVSIYNRALSANEVFQNYEATRERFNRPTIVTDDDVRNFLNSANISSETQQRAVNDLVVDMKNAGLWGKMKAIYPFVGGTATTHKWNLKDPRDVDAAFRLTFYGGWTHSSNGVLGNGTNGYADTFLNLSTALSQDSASFSIYSRTNNTSAKRDMGSGDYTNDSNYAYTSMELVLNGKHYYRVNAKNGKLMSSNLVNTLGLFVMNRIASNDIRFYKNNSKIDTDTESSSFRPDTNFTLAAMQQINRSVTPNVVTQVGYSDRQYAFATIGDGLTDTDAANLYTIVQKYQTTLGRQV